MSKLHSWTSTHFRDDYVQTMILARLISGCPQPLDQACKCPSCHQEKNRQVKELFKSTWPYITEPRHPSDLRTYRLQAAKAAKHRDFLDVRRRYGTRRTQKWYAQQFEVSEKTIERWLRTERLKPRLKAQRILQPALVAL